ncbi:trypsin-like serine protease [Streptomyces sp. NPDC048404]|uniref:S1 family peptidase n=2 Tax=unclassified Streptomyces TaxID=2593676 RepID=UPI00341C3331
MSRTSPTKETKVMRHLRGHRLAPFTTAFTTRLAASLAAALLALSATPANAVSGTAAADGALAFTARLEIGDGQKACSATLVDPYWLLTATSCFADNPAVSLAIPTGAPKLKTTATIGRTDLTTTGGETRTVVELVAHPSRDAVLARLSRPVTTITPVSLATAAATPGEELAVAGYGRTATEWAPLRLHSGTFAVDSVAADTVATTGKDGASVCMGDTGGPAVRLVSGKPELVAVSSRSWQGGCFGTDPAVTQTGAVSTRVDDLRSWVTSTVAVPPAAANGAWRAYGNTNPISSSTSKWHCASSKTITTGVVAQACAIRSSNGTGVQAAIVVRNNQSGLYGAEARMDLYTASGTRLGDWKCPSSGVGANSWSVCFGTTLTESSQVNSYGMLNGAYLGLSSNA